ncbi:MAG: hypothetical protein ACI39E_00975 [Acutalibacteraceae bacterium]
MIKTLLKKQMLEVFSWVYRDRKSGKNRDKNGVVGIVLLYLILFVFLGSVFFQMALSLCEPLLSQRLGWLYMVLMSFISIALGVFGSVFSTYSSLYLAKDNDFLLSMPISAPKILFVRLAGVYVTGLIYELIVMVPAVIVFFMYAEIGVLGILFSVLIPFVLSVFILTLSCILGFVVALISSKMKRKTAVTVILSLAFIAGYYYIYSQAYAILEFILADPTSLGSQIQSWLYPFYHMGLAAEGNALSMLLFTAVIALLFGVVYFVLSATFLKVATANRGGKKIQYKEKAVKAGNISSALLKKEFRRFLSSSTYMLNCGLGVVLMLIGAVALIVEKGELRELIEQIFPGAQAFLSLAAVAAICLIVSMNDITAPSVSLEGKTIWLVKSYPIPAKAVLYAKLKLHLILTWIPALILTAAVLFVMEPSPLFCILISAAVVLFVILSALWGLFLGLKMPNLNWTTETVPVKQSMSVMFALFGGWLFITALGILYFAVSQWIDPTVYLLLFIGFTGALSAVLFGWIKSKGTAVFDSL